MGTTQVDPAELAKQARTVCQIAEDLRIAASGWRSQLASPGDGCKLSTVTAAVEDVRDVWGKDFSVYYEVLQQWCDAAQAAAQGYKSVDEYAAAQHRHLL